MKTIEIADEFYSVDKIYPKVRNAARAVIFDRDKRIFAEITSNPKVVMLPGGGLEGDEDAFECAVRECAEECGLIVKPVKPLFNIREYYRDCIFFSTYVLCKIVGECEKHLTEKEKAINIISGWRDMGDVLSDIEDLMKRYKDIDGELYGCHKREYIAIKELIDSRI